jgi:hypothetical protein
MKKKRHNLNVQIEFRKDCTKTWCTLGEHEGLDLWPLQSGGGNLIEGN